MLQKFIIIIFCLSLIACGHDKNDDFYMTAEMYNTQDMSGGVQFIGDSITYFWPVDLMPDGSYNRGIAGSNIDCILERMWLTEKEQPEEIYLMIGIVDLLHGALISDALDGMNEILLQFAERIPDCEIHVFSVIPSERVYFGTVKDFNDGLEPLVLSHGNVVEYIDVFDLFFNGEVLHQPDGIHPSYYGYELIYNKLMETRQPRSDFEE